ncbi:hypothetical protein ABZ951_19045 [Streptomyces sp. NPDC046215]
MTSILYFKQPSSQFKEIPATVTPSGLIKGAMLTAPNTGVMQLAIEN